MAKALDAVPKIKSKLNSPRRDLNFEPSFEQSQPGLKPKKHNRPAGSRHKPVAPLNRGETFVCPQGWLITCHYFKKFLFKIYVMSITILNVFVSLYGLIRLIRDTVSLNETLIEPNTEQLNQKNA